MWRGPRRRRRPRWHAQAPRPSRSRPSRCAALLAGCQGVWWGSGRGGVLENLTAWQGNGQVTAGLCAGCQGARPEPAAASRPPPHPLPNLPTQAAIAAASTLEEVRRLEDALRTGHLPSEVVVGGEGGEAAANGAAAMDEG